MVELGQVASPQKKFFSLSRMVVCHSHSVFGRVLDDSCLCSVSTVCVMLCDIL